MLLGVNVPNFGPGADPGLIRAWAQTVEGLGFDLLMISDHVVITPDVAEQYPAPFLEPFTTLAWLAGITERVRLGTTVLIVPYRHPLLVARMATDLDRLSGGRLILGVGVGWARQEFAALGVDFERRGRLTDEHLDAIRAAWAGDGPAGADGRAPGEDRRGIPIWVGGNSDAGVRRAVRRGDAWHPLRFPAGWLGPAVGRLRAAAAAAGRPEPGLAPRIALRITDRPLPDGERLTGEGSIEQIVGDLDELRGLGAVTVVLDPLGGDPEETRHPQPAWQALATVAAHRTPEREKRS